MSDRQINADAALELLRAEVELLRRQNPDMDDDERLFADMVEGSTSADDLIQKFLDHWFEKNAIVVALHERCDKVEAQRDRWKTYIAKARRVAGITETQRFALATIFQRKAPDFLEYDKRDVPEDLMKVDEAALRQALKSGREIKNARLLPSNLPPSTTIRTK